MSNLSFDFKRTYKLSLISIMILIIGALSVQHLQQTLRSNHLEMQLQFFEEMSLNNKIAIAAQTHDNPLVPTLLKQLEKIDEQLIEGKSLNNINALLHSDLPNLYNKGIDDKIFNYINYTRNCTKFKKVSCSNIPHMLEALNSDILSITITYEKKIRDYIKLFFTLIYALLIFTLLLLVINIFVFYRPFSKKISSFIEDRERNEKFQNIINDASTNAIIAVDKNLTILTFNQGAQHIFGYTKLEMIGQRNLNKIIPKDYLSEQQRAFKLFIETKNFKHEKQSIEVYAKRNNGETFPVKITYYSNNDLNNLIIVANIQDITNEKQQEQKLMSNSRSAAMGEMIGNIAHQWRQPLNAISTLATGMKMRKKNDMISDDEIYDSLDKIKEYTHFLSQTIDDFKNFFKKEKNITVFSIQDVITKAKKLVEASLKDNAISLYIKMPEEPLLSKGLPNELSQVFINILNNAKDVLINKDDKLIIIKLSASNDDLEVSIQDSGGGVPEHVIKKIFEPYFTTKHKSQGTGIGLYMSRNIVVNMNGTIEVVNDKFVLKGKTYTGAKFSIKMKTVSPETDGDAQLISSMLKKNK